MIIFTLKGSAQLLRHKFRCLCAHNLRLLRMGTDTLTKEMASALVERIYVDAEKNIDIRLRYRDEYMALLKFIEGRAAV